ncbi:7-carboxy-7-deazaguanine synthase [Chitinivorax tropicus]|uniref:7-carboxy-7-deazaguanine synthase n=1 Tax=Chitinivorax tropicus TaxID=714531 RepID=A0A840MJF0_9PROT|nr:7-carboxy-7-deazaguanine synthase QueE [Chitinivorax tropicus]MBB5017309.1 7-carboxy-7-deazaguanine synthase [Chitinivorax tropicus]
MSTKQSLRITEIFFSLQGETSRVGLPTVFVRLTGCPLRCGYCDSEYAFHGGESWTIDRILEEIRQHGTPYVCVTGGEPLAQKGCLTLLTRLCDEGFAVSLETSGALPIDHVDPRVSRIVDIKTPGSGEVMKNHWQNLNVLTRADELKFVICHEADYQWARQLIMDYSIHHRCPVLMSPVHGGVEPDELANWILRDKLPVRYQLQLHKVLWGNTPGK